MLGASWASELPWVRAGDQGQQGLAVKVSEGWRSRSARAGGQGQRGQTSAPRAFPSIFPSSSSDSRFFSSSLFTFSLSRNSVFSPFTPYFYQLFKFPTSYCFVWQAQWPYFLLLHRGVCLCLGHNLRSLGPFRALKNPWNCTRNFMKMYFWGKRSRALYPGFRGFHELSKIRSHSLLQGLSLPSLPRDSLGLFASCLVDIRGPLSHGRVLTTPLSVLRARLHHSIVKELRSQEFSKCHITVLCFHICVRELCL